MGMLWLLRNHILVQQNLRKPEGCPITLCQEVIQRSSVCPAQLRSRLECCLRKPQREPLRWQVLSRSCLCRGRGMRRRDENAQKYDADPPAKSLCLDLPPPLWRD